MSRRSEILKRQNDKFRRDFAGGRVFLTSGVVALGVLAQDAIVAIVKNYNRFTKDIDPRGEHDMGYFTYAGHKLYWKIDYYDAEFKYGSDDPTDPNKTRRVLTIMLASEY